MSKEPVCLSPYFSSTMLAAYASHLLLCELSQSEIVLEQLSNIILMLSNRLSTNS